MNLRRMAKVHDFWKMWQGSRNLRTTQTEFQAQNKQMTAVGYIPDREDVVKASWSNNEHDSATVY
jgi:DNA-binding response OmpR family regulator